ncbi:Y+L amino acid transporter 2-like [Saccoglossus kowalevskii]|uniref:Y+L amino acid transporter 2-like n=1 Tax=Saccoglossus kowalevskii TaxID=10224 RepID=A0ABM0LVE7_SACKO|nr:PREDICTED: Y+L amino acid transporter 2-like [Saccoglossus kowalevskii]
MEQMEEFPQDPDVKGENDAVAMKKEFRLFSSICIIVGSIVGSGIFISPKGVLYYSGSVGTALIVWAACGIIALLGGLCYAELGSSIPKSGAEYTYMNEAFGPFVAYLQLWVSVIIVSPATIAIVSQTFAVYVIVPFYPDCVPPSWVVILVSEACIICVYTYNCVTVRGAAWVQNICTVFKVLGLGIIILVGVVRLCQGETQYLNFDGPGTNVFRLSLAFFNGLYSYMGWSILNAVTEEMNNPKRDFPIAASFSMITITIIYVMANISYFTVMSPMEVLQSPAVAVTFGDQVLGNFAWLMPVTVALSTFGTTNGSVLGVSRLVFVAARDGMLPDLLSMVNIRYNTPMPAIISGMILSVIYGLYPDVGVLINYTGFSYWLFVGIVVTGLLWLRYKQPNRERPFKVPIGIAIFFALFCYFLVFLSIFIATMEAVIGTVIILTGIPVYFYGVVWKSKPRWLKNILDTGLRCGQKMMLVVRQEKKTY